MVGSQQGLRCGSICPVTTGQESVVNRCATSPHSVTDFSSAPSRPEHSRNDPVRPSSAMHGLAEVLSFGEPLKTCLAPKIQWQHAFEYAVDGSTSQTDTGSNSPLLNALTGKCKHLMLIPIGVGRGIVRTIRKIFEKICKY